MRSFFANVWIRRRPLWLLLLALILTAGCDASRDETDGSRLEPPPEVETQAPDPASASGDGTGGPGSASEGSGETGGEPGGSDPPDLGRYRIPPEAIGTLPREIEDEAGEAMRHFCERLLAAARGEPETVVRVLLFSDSLNGTDRVGSALRHALAERFGDGGKGFVPIATGWGSQDHRDVEWTHRTWRTLIVNRGRDPLDRYGLGGVIARNGGARSLATFATVDEGPSNRAVSRFRLYYQAWPEGGEVSLRVDRDPPVVVDTAAPEPEDRFHDLRVPEGPHRLAVGVEDGDLRLYGVVLERDGPGVTVDSLMYIGATVSTPAQFDREHFEGQIRARRPDLLVFWLGANDVRSRAFDQEEFTEDFSAFIERARAARPEASCLVMSEPDQGILRRGRLRSRHNVPGVIAGQEAAARRQGCAFLNLYEAAGGEGSVVRWFRGRRRLISGDYLHLTVAGANHVADLLHRALLQGYDGFLSRPGSPSPPR